MKLSERIEQVKELQKVDIPWEFRRIFGRLEMFGNQLCVMGSDQQDYVEIEEMQGAVTWLVNELGGQVKWKKEKKK